MYFLPIYPYLLSSFRGLVYDESCLGMTIFLLHKQVPPTRAKSPKLGRRKSCGDATNLIERENCGGVCCRLQRHSLGACADATTKLKTTPKNRNTIKAKEGGKSTNEKSKPLADKAAVKVAVKQNSRLLAEEVATQDTNTTTMQCQAETVVTEQP